MKKFYVPFLLFILLFLNCFPYVYYEQNKVLIQNIDIDTTLKIAEIELQKESYDRVLTVWVIRDQIFNENQVKIINDLYFKYIDNLKGEFEIWHYAWAISNIYRNGNDSIKEILKNAYADAKQRPLKLDKFKKIADEHINGNKIYMGDVHQLGRLYANKHIVVPGNKEYIQTYEQYLSEKNK